MTPFILCHDAARLLASCALAAAAAAAGWSLFAAGHRFARSQPAGSALTMSCDRGFLREGAGGAFQTCLPRLGAGPVPSGDADRWRDDRLAASKACQKPPGLPPLFLRSAVPPATLSDSPFKPGDYSRRRAGTRGEFPLCWDPAAPNLRLPGRPKVTWAVQGPRGAPPGRWHARQSTPQKGPRPAGRAARQPFGTATQSKEPLRGGPSLSPSCRRCR